MQRVFKEETEYSARRLGKDDWGAYRRFHLTLRRPEFFNEHFDDGNIHDPREWKEMFSWLLADRDFPNDFMFALFDGEKIVGSTALRYRYDGDEKIAVFTGSQIADEYLGRGLSRYLYDVRQRHLENEGFHGRKETWIRPTNVASLKAAYRNGFTIENPDELWDDHLGLVYTGIRQKFPGLDAIREITRQNSLLQNRSHG